MSLPQAALSPQVSPRTSQAVPDSPVRWRVRSDLEFTPLEFSGTPLYTVKDPVSVRYYQLREEEYFLLTQLDGLTSVRQLQLAFERRFPQHRLTAGKLYAYITSLERLSLIVSDVPGHGERLRQRHVAQQRAERRNRLTGFLAIRFRGADPHRFLNAVYGSVRPLFHPRTLVLAAGLMIAALTTILTGWETLTNRLPEFSAFLTLENLLNLAIALSVVKVLHELGHALTCRHFGGECHEIGLMLLLFTPCLYCDVSDAWQMPGKWHRIAVSAAGILVELTLAAVCTLLWWFTEPGRLNVILLNIMIVCSVNTLLFNGNPLMRFDGYFVLADLMEVPNLRQSAGLILRNRMLCFLFGMRLSEARQVPAAGQRFLLIYAIAAILYRVTVIIGILWMLHAVFGRLGLLPVAHLAATVLISMIALSGISQLRMISAMMSNSKAISLRRTIITVLSGTAFLAAFFFLPLPHRISAPCIVEVEAGQTVFVSVDGRRSPAASYPEVGDFVEEGAVLIQLRNPDLDVRINELTGQISVLKSRLESLRIRRVSNPSIASQIPQTEESLTDLAQQLDALQERRRQLTVRAPRSGMVFPVEHPPISETDDIESAELNPLDRRRRGDSLVGGTPVCEIGDPRKRVATLYVDQSDIELVQTGQSVEIWLNAANDVVRGSVMEISSRPAETVAPNVAVAGLLPTIPSTSGNAARSVSVVFLVRVSLQTDGAHTPDSDFPAAALPPGTTGIAAVRIRPRTPAQRLARLLSGTLRFTNDFQAR